MLHYATFKKKKIPPNVTTMNEPAGQMLNPYIFKPSPSLVIQIKPL